MAEAETGWWLSLDGWQLEADEVPGFRVDTRLGLTIGLSWLRPPALVDAETSRRRYRRNLYDVVGRVVGFSEGDVRLEVAGQHLVSMDHSNLHGVSEGSMLSGRARLEFSAVWGALDESPFRELFVVREILVRESRSRSGGVWRAVKEARDPAVYLVLCEPSP